MVAEAAGDDDEVAVGALVAGDRAWGWESREVFGQGPAQVALDGAGDEADIGGDLESSDVGCGVSLDQSLFGGAESDGDGGLDGGALGEAGVGMEAGGDIHGEDRNTGVVDGIDEFLPVVAEGAVQAYTEDAVDDESLWNGEERVEFLEGGAWFEGVEESDFAVLQVGNDLTGVIAIVAFACEDEDGVAWSGELADSGG
ncbi:MAG: hypothetical protein RI897_90 [Verrucomicrobiota bacterium]